MASRVPARPSNFNDQSWFDLARSVASEAAGSGHGGHEQIYEAQAGERGLHVQSIKRALTAFKFVSKVAASDHDRAMRLKAMPIAAVLALSRWYDHDREGAFAAMARCESGEISARQLEAEEKKARKRNADFVAQLTKYEGLYELDAFDTAFSHLHKDWRSEPAGPFDDYGAGPFSRTFRHRRNGSLCLLQVPGPFETTSRWVAERNLIMLSALGAAALGHHVLIVVPAEQRIKRLFDEWLARFSSPETKITVIETVLRQLPPDPDDLPA